MPALKQEIRFCIAPDGTRVAYAVMGSGPPLLKAANWLSHLEYDLESPIWRHWFKELSRDHTLIRYDERGCGLSDWDMAENSFEAWVTDLETVANAAGFENFSIIGISQGGPVAIDYTVRHPERVKSLVLYGTYTRGWKVRGDSPTKIAESEALITLTEAGWGRDIPVYRELFTKSFVPDANEKQRQWFNELQRKTCSPANAVALQRALGPIDVTALLPRVEVPTLVLHARGDMRCPLDEGRRVAAGIRGSRFVLLESQNHILLAHEPAWQVFLHEVRNVSRSGPDPVSRTNDESETRHQGTQGREVGHCLSDGGLAAPSIHWRDQRSVGVADLGGSHRADNAPRRVHRNRHRRLALWRAESAKRSVLESRHRESPTLNCRAGVSPAESRSATRLRRVALQQLLSKKSGASGENMI